jgi:metastasis-associated protein MTA
LEVNSQLFIGKLSPFFLSYKTECIYMEVFPPPMPYQICKIEELRKNTKGSVEVAAKCFYRRKDLPPSVLLCADRHSIVVEEENELEGVAVSSFSFDKLSEQERHLVRHRELFLSRQIETYKIDMVRGKCSVTLLNELEDVRTYLVKEDTFFYSMVYDPNVKNLLVDKGDIRVGTDFQAEVPPYVPPESREEPSHLATKVWEPNKMPDHKVEQFLVVARSIGTFARALLDGAKKPQISLRLGAAAASRDITLFHAMDTLHQNDYDITQATSYLVPRGPVLCADELEAWTQEEAKRFEEGLQEQKDFLYIQKKYLSWKPVKSITAYYYMWKTTDRYQIQKRHRMIEKQNDLKEVIVHLRTPSGAQTGPRDLSGKAASSGVIPASLPPSNDVPRTTDGERGCESCLATTAARWYMWGPAHEHCRLCNLCYTYWRKYGGLKLPTRWEANEKKAGVMTATALLQRKLNKDRPPGPPKSSKKAPRHVAARKSGDIIPPVPFCMRPSPHTLFVRQGMCGRSLMRAARHPTSTAIDPKSSPKPSLEALQRFIAGRRRAQRRPSTCHSLASTLNRQSVHTSPVKQLIVRPSPTPISPGYKAAKASKTKVVASGTYVPPKTMNRQITDSRAAKTHLASSSGVYVPPSNVAPPVTESRKRKLEGPQEPERKVKVACPPSPATLGPGELFFRADKGTKLGTSWERDH